MTLNNMMTERQAPHGLALNFKAPFSGQLEEEVIVKALAKIPEALEEARAVWSSIDEVRNSGLAPIYDDGPLDDAVRDGVWNPALQVPMPTVGGLPGSRGKKIPWQHQQGANEERTGASASFSTSTFSG